MLNNKLKPVKSSMIKAYSYDAQTLELTVIFSNGKERVYKQVQPPDMSQVFDAPGSIGSKFHKIIGSRYQHSQE